MLARPIPADLKPWAQEALGLVAEASTPALEIIAGDASNRRYFRLATPRGSYVVVDAPPSTEKNTEFSRVHQLLQSARIRVPAMLAMDLGRGYMLLEDLGDRVLLPELDETSVDGYYQSCFQILAQFRTIQPESELLPRYDRPLLTEELSRFPEWFVASLLSYPCDDAERALVERLAGLLIDNALAQPQGFVHRDFHSRNLMLVGQRDLAVIDFQDAVYGPITYDLASLLKDCYIRWPRAQVCRWALAYRDELVASQILAPTADRDFLRWFDLMGLQRHIKVLGTFARLYLRNHKAAYLDDLPMVIQYVQETLHLYAESEPAVAEFKDWFDDRLMPLVGLQSWGGTE
ncbi:MAG: aminoglycoside/choline kinase family phosphotransferase [Alcanivorax sp.]